MSNIFLNLQDSVIVKFLMLQKMPEKKMAMMQTLIEARVEKMHETRW